MIPQLRPSKSDSHSMRTAKQKARAKLKRVYQIELRERQTAAELYLWEALKDKQLGEKFTPQAIVKGFIVDFWCGRLRLAVEVDGPIHLKRQDYDRRRDQVISDSYVTILRFSNDDVLWERASCVEKIRTEMGRLSATPAAKRRTTIMLKAAGKNKALVSTCSAVGENP